MKKILLYGQGSYDNKGCEAIVVSTAEQIKRKENRIVSATFDYKNSNKLHKNLIDKYINHYYKEGQLKGKYKELNERYKRIPFDYMNFEKLYQHDVIDEIKTCDICLSIGGDNYCYGYSRWLYAINDEIRKQNKKNVLWCASLYEEITDNELIYDMQNFDVIMAREPITYRELKKYVNSERLMLVPDPAFGLEPEKIELPALFKNKVIGINISPLVSKQGTKTYESVISLINYILENTEYSIALIPHVFLEESNDLSILKKIKENFKNEKRISIVGNKNNNCRQLKYIISQCDLMIAARTHASIAAYSTAVPTLVIGYSVKSKGIAEYLFDDYKDYVISYEDLTSTKLINGFKLLVQRRLEIQKKLSTKMKKIKKQATCLFETLENKLKELDEQYVTLQSYCTGCMACVSKCPSNAITIKEDKEGFKIPVINKKKCINCGACKKCCPNNIHYEYKYEGIKAYAAYNKSDEFFNKSSSGAVFPVLAKNLLNKNWIIYGCAFENKAKHIRITSVDELNKLLGSKYVQSDINSCYKKIRDDLSKGINVLFSGVPCQIEGLKKYLGKEYNNLYCVSVICHGVPNEKTLDKYLYSMYSKQSPSQINFRYNENGIKKVKYEFNDRNYTQDFGDDVYIKAFLENYSLRNSCYKCNYKLYIKNTSDIILGDYWGYEQYHNLNNPNGNISAVIINSKKGEFLFKTIEKEINYEATNIENIIRGNILLTQKVPYTRNRAKFFTKIESSDFCDTVLELEREKLFERSQEEIKLLIEENKKLKEEKNDLSEKLNYVNNVISNILGSKKWKFATIIFDPLIKLKNKIKHFKG